MRPSSRSRTGPPTRARACPAAREDARRARRRPGPPAAGPTPAGAAPRRARPSGRGRPRGRARRAGRARATRVRRRATTARASAPRLPRGRPGARAPAGAARLATIDRCPAHPPASARRGRARHGACARSRRPRPAGWSSTARRAAPRVALIGRLDRRGRLLWSLPKGHLEDGETAEDAAVREVEEETGIRGRVLAPLGTIDYWFVADDRRIHKTVHHYLLEADGRRAQRHRPRGRRGRLGAAARARGPPGLRRRAPARRDGGRPARGLRVSSPTRMTPTRSGAGLLVVLLVLAPLLAAGAPAPSSPAAGAAEADDEPVVLRVDALSPSVATTGSTLRVAGRVANVGRQALRDVEVRLRLSDTRLNSRAELDAVARGETTSLDGDAVVAQGLADVDAGPDGRLRASPAGSTTSPPLTEFGVYVLGVEVLATRGSGFGRVAIQRTLLPWVPVRPRPAADRVHLAVAAGVAADPAGRRHLRRRLAGRGDDRRRPPAAARRRPASALTEGAALTWVVDPELVAAAEDMANGYRVRAADGSVVQGGARRSPPPGSRACGPPPPAGRSSPCPTATPRLSAVTRAGLARRRPGRPRPGRRDRPRRSCPPPVTSPAPCWPVDGYVNRAALAALRPRRHHHRRARRPGRARSTIDLSYTPSRPGRPAHPLRTAWRPCSPTPG